MVHNGIEYVIMAAYAEGLGVYHVRVRRSTPGVNEPSNSFANPSDSPKGGSEQTLNGVMCSPQAGATIFPHSLALLASLFVTSGVAISFD
jgi:6-phosphogluconate dehydrogenase (decarboxylating)